MLKKILIFLGILLSVNLSAQTVGIFQNDSTAFNGYTLFSPTGFNKTYLIDNCGFVINEWESEHDPGMMAYLLPNGNLLRTARISSSFSGGGTGGRLEIYDWEGDMIWSYNYSSPTFHQHHDIEPLPNGNILILAWDAKTQSEATMEGRDPDEVGGQGLWSEKVVEIEPIGTNDINVVWEWHLWDHLVQDFNNVLPNYGVIADSPGLIDLNYATESGTDWIHCNSIDYNPELDQIMLSSRNFNELWVIDHSTTTLQASQHSGGISGKGGDILFRWGNPQTYQRGTEDDQKLFGQHDVHWIESGLKDEGKIMIFNNGINRPIQDFSSIEIINPPLNVEGNYLIEPNQPFEPIEADWVYMADPPASFLAQRVSGAQRLPNGNTLICNGRDGEFFEINEENEQVWFYVNPVGNNGPITQGNPAQSNDVFRSTRYPTDYSAFEGKDLTPKDPIELNPTMNDCMIFVDPVSTNENQTQLGGIKVLGNPIYNELRIENLTNERLSIEVLDVMGKPVFSDYLNNQNIKISSVNWQSGMYFIRISNENSTKYFIQKLIKNNG